MRPFPIMRGKLWIVVAVTFLLINTLECKRKPPRKKFKLKLGSSSTDPNLTIKEGKKQANQQPKTDARISDYGSDEVKGDPSIIHDVKDKYESGVPPKFPAQPRTSDVTAHDSEITGCRDHPNAAKVCQRCDQPCFGEEHETYTFSYCRRSCGMCDKSTSTFHQYWRLRAGSPFEPTWMLKEVEFYHLTSSNKSLVDDPKKAYAKNFYQGFVPSFAFDGNKDTAWFPDNYGSNHSNNDDWIAFEFPVAVRIHGVRIVNDKDHPTSSPRKVYVEASDKKFDGFETKWIIDNPTYNVDQISTLNECPVLWKKYHEPDDSAWCFRLFAQRKSWDEAAETCKEEGGTLASVLAKQEEEFLTENVNFCGFTWLGLSKQNGAYYWEDGSNSTWHDWKDDLKYSDDQTKNLVCVAMDPNGKWVLFDCENKNYFVCRKKLETKNPPRPDLVPSPFPYPPEVPPVIFFSPNVTVPVINTHNLPAGAFPDANGEIQKPEEEPVDAETLTAIFYQQTLKHLLEKGLKPTADMKPGPHEDPGKYTKQLNKIALEANDAGTKNESGVKPSVNLEAPRLPQTMNKEIPVQADINSLKPSTDANPDEQIGLTEPAPNKPPSSGSPVNGPPTSDVYTTNPTNVPSQPSGNSKYPNNPSLPASNNKDDKKPDSPNPNNDATSKPPSPDNNANTNTQGATTSESTAGKKPEGKVGGNQAKVKPPKSQEGTEGNPPASIGEAGEENDEEDNDDDDDDDDEEDNGEDNDGDFDNDDDDENIKNLPESPNQTRNKDRDVDKSNNINDKDATVGGQNNKGVNSSKERSGTKKKGGKSMKTGKKITGQSRSHVTEDSKENKELNDIIKSMKYD